MSTPALQDYVAVITGASHGLGEAIAHHLSDLGAKVVLIARKEEPLKQTAADIQAKGGYALALPCDIADKEQVRATAQTIIQKLGDVDILVNNAGIPAPRTFDATKLEDWDDVIATNLTGAFYMTRALWFSLCSSKRGYVIQISGTAGVRGGGSPAYGSAKFGLTGLNHSIAVAGEEHNLRATILYPGSMDTGWRGAPIGEKPASETMDPDEVAKFVGHLVTSPPEFVINEAVLSPIGYPFT